MEKKITTTKLLARLRSSVPTTKTPPNRFELAWARLRSAFPRQETTEATMMIYYERLATCDPNELDEAVAQCIDEVKFFPMIAEILERIHSPRGCVHHLKQVEIQKREEAVQLREQLWEKDKAEHDSVNEQIIRLKAEMKINKTALWAKEKAEMEQVGLPEVQAKVEAANAELKAVEEKLIVERRRLQLMDQADFLQRVVIDTEKEKSH